MPAKKELLLIAPALLLSGFIYIFYRTEKTVVNQMIITLTSRGEYRMLRAGVRHHLALPDFIIYSLPEGLWVFCITLTSKPFYIRAGRLVIQGFAVPLVFAIGLEGLQLLHIAHGHFDMLDIASAISFWLLACYGLKAPAVRANLLSPITLQGVLCIMSYAVVYLAHVMRLSNTLYTSFR